MRLPENGPRRPPQCRATLSCADYVERAIDPPSLADLPETATMGIEAIRGIGEAMFAPAQHAVLMIVISAGPPSMSVHADMV